MYNVKEHTIGGFTVYCGKDAASNDHVTFDLSGEEDIWMHVRSTPGSHVLIKVKDQLPGPGIIKEAAILAAKHSKAPRGKATVLYCQKKYVTKQRYAPAGEVLVDTRHAVAITVLKE